MSKKSEGRMFPIRDGDDVMTAVPWSVMAPHENQAQRNHGQSLERLAERGGLSPGEAWCVVNGFSCCLSKAGWESATQKWKEFVSKLSELSKGEVK